MPRMLTKQKTKMHVQILGQFNLLIFAFQEINLVAEVQTSLSGHFAHLKGSKKVINKYERIIWDKKDYLQVSHIS